MSYDLVCANCLGLVKDGGCTTCRVSRERLRQARTLPAGPFLVLAALVGLLAVLLH